MKLILFLVFLLGCGCTSGPQVRQECSRPSATTVAAGLSMAGGVTLVPLGLGRQAKADGLEQEALNHSYDKRPNGRVEELRSQGNMMILSGATIAGTALIVLSLDLLLNDCYKKKGR